MCTSEKLSPYRQGRGTGVAVLLMHFIYLKEYFTLVLYKMEGHGDGGGHLHGLSQGAENSISELYQLPQKYGLY